MLLKQAGSLVQHPIPSAPQELQKDGALLEGAAEAGRIQLLRNEPGGSFS